MIGLRAAKKEGEDACSPAAGATLEALIARMAFLGFNPGVLSTEFFCVLQCVAVCCSLCVAVNGVLGF